MRGYNKNTGGRIYTVALFGILQAVGAVQCVWVGWQETHAAKT